MGYVSDWDSWAKAMTEGEAAKAARRAETGCTMEPDCPATDHDLMCKRYRRARFNGVQAPHWNLPPETDNRAEAADARGNDGGTADE